MLVREEERKVREVEELCFAVTLGRRLVPYEEIWALRMEVHALRNEKERQTKRATSKYDDKPDEVIEYDSDAEGSDYGMGSRIMESLAWMEEVRAVIVVIRAGTV